MSKLPLCLAGHSAGETAAPTTARRSSESDTLPHSRGSGTPIRPPSADDSSFLTSYGGCHQPAACLLTNDALLVAVMQANGFTKLASHDNDFDRVPGMTRYAPH
ncbi:MAG: type II toxin-antitoxin system VapC family toxin [Planctomycetota bacterium]|nr:MAG: type II toxin-antitoxin system VapC family toxin [Planctomycetota bacterium]